MDAFTRIFRLLHISFVLLKYGLDDLVLRLHLFRPLRFLMYLSPTRLRGLHRQPRGERIRHALEELGPIFVKFGQLLSTRGDIVPEDIIKELIQLTDKVPPFPGVIAEQIISKALNQPLSECFKSFEVIPLASASVAQVHAATLPDNREVVVKVLRPNIHKIIARDVSLLKTVANLAHRYWREARQFKPKEIIAEFEKTLEDELDLMREAANASQLRRNFLDSSLLYVPEIYWPLTKSNVLVMERIYGIPISNIELLKQHGFNLQQLAELGVEIFFTQVFRDCFFHADMHSGNIFVSYKNKDTPTLIAVDFGIMGTLGPKDQQYLAENFLAFFNRDYRRVAELHVESGWVPASTRIDEFESAIRMVCEPIFERPIKEISFAGMLLRLIQTAKRFQVNIQPQLVLLQKTLMGVEGLGRTLYPELDLWKTAKPFLENWMRERSSATAFFKKFRKECPYWLEKLPDLPNLVYRALQNAATTPPLQPVEPHIIVKTSKTNLYFGILLGMGMSALYLWAKGYF